MNCYLRFEFLSRLKLKNFILFFALASLYLIIVVILLTSGNYLIAEAIAPLLYTTDNYQRLKLLGVGKI